MTNGTRTFLELRVGRSHSVSVLLHLRRKDVEWFHSSPDHKEELFRVISQHILPNECANQIEAHNKYRTGPPTPEAGEKNKPKRGGKKGGKKRKAAPEPKEKEEKPKRSVRNVFGDGLQVTYRVEDTTDDKGATLIFPKKKTSETTSESFSKASTQVAAKKFRQVPRLSKRIVLWCYPRKEGEDLSQQDEGGGFPRPEMVPITSLFRAPPADEATG